MNRWHLLALLLLLATLGSAADLAWEARTGTARVHLRSGDLIEWIRLNGAIKELFDVAAIADTACPMALGVQSPDIQSLITYDPEFGPLQPPALNPA